MRPSMHVVCCLIIAIAAADAAAQARTAEAFQPDRRLFARLFRARPDIRPRVAPAPPAIERQRPANRVCPDCEDRPGLAHVVFDSPRLTDAWLERHTYHGGGTVYGDNHVVADLWYDGVHRRLFTRSLVLHEVDDPADLRLGRAPGTYPNHPDFDASLGAGTTVGHVGFVLWNAGGFGSYFAAVQGAVADDTTGYLDLSTATGGAGTTRTGSRYQGDDLIKHVRLHPSGQLEVGFETDPAARPDASLLVRGNVHVEGALVVDQPAPQRGLSCRVRAASGAGRTVAVSCEPGEVATGGGGACGAGDMRVSRPLASGETPVGWELACGSNGPHAVQVICCSR